MDIFIEIVTNLYSNFGRIAIFMMSGVLIQNEDIFLYIQIYLYDFQQLLKFFTCEFYKFLFRFISKYSIFYCSCKLNHLLYFLTTSVCVDKYWFLYILYPSTWLNFLIICVSFSIKPTVTFRHKIISPPMRYFNILKMFSLEL